MEERYADPFRLPNELWIETLKYASALEWKQIRRTCKHLNTLTTLLLFQRVLTSAGVAASPFWTYPPTRAFCCVLGLGMMAWAVMVVWIEPGEGKNVLLCRGARLPSRHCQQSTREVPGFHYSLLLPSLLVLLDLLVCD